jgi:hypothetical protein
MWLIVPEDNSLTPAKPLFFRPKTYFLTSQGGSITPKRIRKPSKKQQERQDSRPFAHRTGRWAKKCRGSFIYLGYVRDDPTGEAAWNEWLRIRDDVRAGRKPRQRDDETSTVQDLADQFMHAKKQRVLSGELSQRTWNEYRDLFKLVADTLGRNHSADDIRPDDWANLRVVFAKRWGPARVRNAIVYTRLPAVNVGEGIRPRYRVAQEHLEAFLASRTVVPAPKPTRRRMGTASLSARC